MPNFLLISRVGPCSSSKWAILLINVGSRQSCNPAPFPDYGNFAVGKFRPSPDMTFGRQSPL